MEAENQQQAEPDEAGTNAGELVAGNSENLPAATNSTAQDDNTEPGTSSETRSVNDASGADRPHAKRNYRRHTDNSDGGSDDDEMPEAAPPVANTEAEPQQPTSDSDDVSLDELLVSDGDNRQDAQR